MIVPPGMAVDAKMPRPLGVSSTSTRLDDRVREILLEMSTCGIGPFDSFLGELDCSSDGIEYCMVACTMYLAVRFR